MNDLSACDDITYGIGKQHANSRDVTNSDPAMRGVSLYHLEIGFLTNHFLYTIPIARSSRTSI